MAICSALLMFVSLQLGCGLRADHQHVLHEMHREDLESYSNVTRLTKGKCCCYQPVGWYVTTNPFGNACPLEGDKWDRGCAKGLGKAAPCDFGPTKDDVYCQIYHVLDCESKVRHPRNIMWNKHWEQRYMDMTINRLTSQGWQDMRNTTTTFQAYRRFEAMED